MPDDPGGPSGELAARRPRIRVLILEDSATDAELIVRELQRAGYDPDWHRVEKEADFLRALDPVPDLILSDYSLPQFDGLLAATMVRDHGLDIPFILVSGTVGEELAVQAIKHGVHDYLLKDRLTRLGASVAGALDAKRLRDERRQAEAASRAGEDQLRHLAARHAAMLNALPAHVALVDLDGTIREVNQSWRHFGVTNGLREAGCGVGRNYLEICDRASGNDAEEASAAAAGLRRVLGGLAHDFSLEYPCHSPAQQRWFSLMATRLPEGPMAGAVVMHVDITQRKLVENRLQHVLSMSTAVLYSSRKSEGGFVPSWVSENITEMMGCPSADALRPGWWLEHLHPDDRERVLAEFSDKLGAGRGDFDYRFRHADGSYVWIHDGWRITQASDDHPNTLVGSWLDITERRQLENSFRQAQKMEAVGRLAAGIAHDFNNLLTVITAHSFFLEESLPDDDVRRTDVTAIRQVAERAATLTRQLLAFSRQQVLELQVLDLNAVINGASDMLRRLIGEDIEFVTALNPQLGRVRADVGQIEQVIMNLAVNARDAMPRGGTLTIETATTAFDEVYRQGHLGAQPGRYVMLAVTDTGFGMDAVTMSRIFEPFFTTKEVGRGTGLGLAMVYGVVKQSGGFVWVYSEPGQGATFKVYLPEVDDPDAVPAAVASTAGVRAGTEMVLVVEDDPQLRVIARRALEREGYTVLEAPNGQTAIALLEQYRDQVRLLLTDVVMPEIGGRQLAELALTMVPGLLVLYMSGYTDDSVIRQGVLPQGVSFLQKPFSPNALCLKVREALDRARE